MSRSKAGLLALALVSAAVAQATPCTVVFGQGRNVVAADDSAWDEANARFAAQVAGTLEATGRRVVALLGSVHGLDPAASVQRLLATAADQGCITVVETSVFADLDAATLVSRLRAYPVLPAVAGQAGLYGLRFGAPLYSSQREAAWSDAALARLRPEALGEAMAADYLAHQAARR